VYLWCDTETTGLTPATSRIVEIAATITDPSGTRLSDTFTATLPLTSDEWGATDPHVKAMHTTSGLASEITILGPSDVTTARRDADRRLCAWIDAHAPTGHDVVLAGSSTGFDKAMLATHMPLTSSRLHYRTMDVSNIMMLMRAATGEHLSVQGHGNAHRTENDMEDSFSYYVRTVDRLKGAKRPPVPR